MSVLPHQQAPKNKARPEGYSQTMPRNSPNPTKGSSARGGSDSDGGGGGGGGGGGAGGGGSGGGGRGSGGGGGGRGDGGGGGGGGGSGGSGSGSDGGGLNSRDTSPPGGDGDGGDGGVSRSQEFRRSERDLSTSSGNFFKSPSIEPRRSGSIDGRPELSKSPSKFPVSKSPSSPNSLQVLGPGPGLGASRSGDGRAITDIARHVMACHCCAFIL